MTTDYTIIHQKEVNTMKQKLTPSYYQGAYKGLEAFDVVMDFQRDNYNLGVAIAYLLRAGKKKDNPLAQDIQKAIDHLQKELEYIHNEERINLNAEATEDDILEQSIRR